MLDGVLRPQEAPLGCQQSWTSYSFGPVIASAVCFLLKGLPHLPQEPLGVSSSSAQDWALTRGQQEAEEGEEEDSLEAWTCLFLGKKAPCSFPS